MRVLLTAGIFPPQIGGPATYVPRIANALAANGHQVAVIAPQDRGVPSPIQDPAYELFRFEHARAFRYLNFILDTWRAFKTILRLASRYDVLYVNGLDLPAALASADSRIPVVTKIVGDYAWEFAHRRRWTDLDLEAFQTCGKLRTRLIKTFLRWGPRRSQAIITPSRYLSQIVAGWGIDRKRIHVVPNAITIPTQGHTYHLPPGFQQGFKILFVGRLIPLKNMEPMIDVIAKIPQARLVIVGDGDLRPALSARAAALGLSNRVHFSGRLPQVQVWDLLQNYADVLVLNSIHETFPHILLEAALCAVPAVATNVGGIPEIITDGQTGLLIPPDSPERLLESLRKLHSDGALRERLGSQARRSASQFLMDDMVTRTEQILLQAAE